MRRKARKNQTFQGLPRTQTSLSLDENVRAKEDGKDRSVPSS